MEITFCIIEERNVLKSCIDVILAIFIIRKGGRDWGYQI